MTLLGRVFVSRAGGHTGTTAGPTTRYLLDAAQGGELDRRRRREYCESLIRSLGG